MSTPFFSIITVVYNAEDVLEGTARSLMEQSTTDYEWIVVDGASKDATLDIARRFAVEGRDTVVSEPDRGVYDAMNKGLRLAQGEVVQFLNAGDRLANAEVLAHVAAAFGEDVDAVYGDTILELADGRVVTRVAFDPQTHIHRRMPISHQSLFTRRALQLQHPFDLSFRIAADYASLAAMVHAGARLAYIAEPLNINTIVPDAISISGKTRSAAEDFAIHRTILERPLAEALVTYLRKRVVILGVSVLQALPAPVFDRLPAKIRKRVY
ncbi:MAG: glycosyltransferase [Maritimibacter sp.]|nr:glycosyltransferase [Maritimibacter sp.]